MQTLIDFHSHVLPGVDHGSADLAESVRQMRLMSDASVCAAVATSHFYPNMTTVEQFISCVDRAATELVREAVDMPPLYLGAEVLFCDGLEQMSQLEQLCIRGTDVLLLELPMHAWSSRLFETVEILSQRMTVVLAHIDRYMHQQAEEIHNLLELGAWAQINASALDSRRKRKQLQSFLQTERVVALGSDLHGADAKAYRPFVAAPKRLGDDYAPILQRSQKLLASAIPAQQLFA